MADKKFEDMFSIFVVVVIVVCMVSRYFYVDGYNKGQVDALNGKQQYKKDTVTTLSSTSVIIKLK